MEPDMSDTKSRRAEYRHIHVKDDILSSRSQLDTCIGFNVI